MKLRGSLRYGLVGGMLTLALVGSHVGCKSEEAKSDGAGGANDDDGAGTGGAGGEDDGAGTGGAGGEDDGAGTGGASPQAEGAIVYTFAPLDTELEVTLGSDTGVVGVPAASVPDEQLPTEYYYSKSQFEHALEETESYEVSLGALSANQSCSVYMGQSGSGADLMEDGALRVGCEWTYDYLSRSTDSSVFGYVSAVAVGGSAVPIGDQEALGEGRFVVFRSGTVGLADNESNRQHIYWRDRLSGVTKLVSRAPDGSEGNDVSGDLAISADGLTVAFASYASNLVEGDTNDEQDIFVWSALDEMIERVSVGPGGEEADAGSVTPTLSGDGKIIAFGTNSMTVVPAAGDSTLNQKIVRIDRTTGERDVISLNKTSEWPVDGSYPMLSEDGDRLVFQSFRDLPGDTNTYSWDIFLYEHSSGGLKRLTLGPDGASHDGAGTCVSCGTAPAISGDGKWVTFSDGSTNLGVDDGEFHYWLVEVDACSAEGGSCNIRPIDLRADGGPGDYGAFTNAAPLSYDGRYVSFASGASNLTTPTVSQTNVYLFDRDAASVDERLRPITTLTGGNTGAAKYTGLSRDGAYLVFRADGHLDPRVDSGGAYAAFTGVGDAFSWYRGPLE